MMIDVFLGGICGGFDFGTPSIDALLFLTKNPNYVVVSAPIDDTDRCQLMTVQQGSTKHGDT